MSFERAASALLTPAGLSRPGTRLGRDAVLWRMVPWLGAGWCATFLAVGLGFGLNRFGDGALFTYAVAAGDSWAFHWRQIPGRVAAWAWASGPAEALGALAGSAELAAGAYAVLFFAAPAVGLVACRAWDRTGVIAWWAALSIAALCPFVFGFPTELWIAHALLWPALALLWTGGWARRMGGGVLVAACGLAHEGGMVWGGVVALALGLSPGPRPAMRAAALGLAGAVAAWLALQWAYAPDPYVAEVLRRNAAALARPWNLVAPVTLTLGFSLTVFLAAQAALGRAGFALGVAAVALAAWWVVFDGSVHAWDRYHLRTLLLGGTPALVVAACWQASGRATTTLARLSGLGPVAACLLALLALVHAVETAKFAAAFHGYSRAVARLAASGMPDASLGNPRFTSSRPADRAYPPIAWHSTTPFLSVLASPGFAPAMLVVDPAAGYFWFGCAEATANAAATRAMPARTREMVRDYTCAHR